MNEPVFATGKETVDEIIEKIISQDDLKGKLAVYHLFHTTWGMRGQSMIMINSQLSIHHSELWKEIDKIYYPSFIENIKGIIKTVFSLK
jgi:hypothetical protein